MSNETTVENVEVADVTTTATPTSVEATAPKAIADLKPKTQLQGKVQAVKLYGAFVDLGLERPGLLHISQLSDKRVTNVSDVVKEGDSVTVYVLDVDKEKGRVNLTLIKPPAMTWDEVKVNTVVKGTVIRIEKFGVFVDIGAERPALVHVSELANDYVSSPEDVVKVGQEVEARVINVDKRKRQIDLSIRALEVVEATSYKDEEEDDALTAMALAFQQAQSQKNESKRDKKRRKHEERDEQDDIIARTLRNSR